MKKALLKLMLKLAMLLALWTLKDQTKSKINRSLKDRVSRLLKKIIGIKDVPEDNAPPEPDTDPDTDGDTRRRIFDYFEHLRRKLAAEWTPGAPAGDMPTNHEGSRSRRCRSGSKQ